MLRGIEIIHPRHSGRGRYVDEELVHLTDIATLENEYYLDKGSWKGVLACRAKTCHPRVP